MAQKSMKSISELVRIPPLGLEKDFSTAFENAKKAGNQQSYNEGYADGKKEWAIWITCAICKKPIDILPELQIHRDIIYMTTGQYCHPECQQY